MLYTTYIDNIEKIPKEAIKLIIMRYPPKNFNILKYQNIYITFKLSPSEELLNKYNSSKKTLNDWKKYEKQFMKEMNQRDDMKKAMNQVAKLVNHGLDVYLICHEVNYNLCHRSILARNIQLIYRIPWKEL